MTKDLQIQELLKQGQLYVNSKGEVFSFSSNTPRKSLGSDTQKGYLRTCIRIDGKKHYFMVHRIACIAAHGVPSPGMQVDHKNCNHIDNHPRRIEWVTAEENIKRAKANGRFAGVVKNSRFGDYYE